MKIKFNWGTGISLFIILFFIALFVFVRYALFQQVNLVEEDYYGKELMYEAHIQKVKNMKALSEKISVNINKQHLTLMLPGSFVNKNVTGTIHFYRPSNYELDHRIPLEPDTNGIQLINLKNLVTGKYIIKLDWMSDSTGYYQEETIILN